MPKRLVTQIRVLACLAVGLLLLSQAPVGVVDALSAGPRNLVDYLQSPLTRPLNAFSNRARSTSDPDLLPDDEKEIRQLYQEAIVLIRRYEEQINELRRRNQELQDVADIFGEQLRGIARVTADIVRAPESPDRPVLVIDRGSATGVEKGNVVIHQWHLVGRIVDVGPMTSTVALITTPDQKLTVRIVPRPDAPKPSLDMQLVDVTYDQREAGFVAVVDRNVPIEAGTFAVLHQGDIRVGAPWPREAMGFFVGKVVEAAPFDQDPTMQKRIVIRPIVELSRLSSVIVLNPQSARANTRGEGTQ